MIMCCSSFFGSIVSKALLLTGKPVNRKPESYSDFFSIAFLDIKFNSDSLMDIRHYCLLGAVSSNDRKTIC